MYKTGASKLVWDLELEKEKLFLVESGNLNFSELYTW